MASRIHIVAEQGPTATVGDTIVTAKSQAITVDFGLGGFTWHRPTDILVERGGRTSRHRLVDVTRTVQLSIYVLAAAFVVWSLLGNHRSRETPS
jgi:hypothetical protein